jgi:hypothetical protein
MAARATASQPTGHPLRLGDLAAPMFFDSPAAGPTQSQCRMKLTSTTVMNAIRCTE